MKKNIAERLHEERLRMGFNKGDMARAGGIANSSYTNYEDGKRSPDADFLAAIAAAGADVNYILTGMRAAESVATTDPLIKMTIEVMQGMTKKQKELIVALFKSEEQNDRKIAA